MDDAQRLEIRRAYRTLNVDDKAAELPIKLAYKTAMKHWHPDRWINQPQEHEKAVAKAQEIIAAYRLIRHAPLKHNQAWQAAPPLEKTSNPPVKKKRLGRKKRSVVDVAEPVIIHFQRKSLNGLLRTRNLVMMGSLVIYLIMAYLFLHDLANFDFVMNELSAGSAVVGNFIGMITQ